MLAIAGEHTSSLSAMPLSELQRLEAGLAIR